MGRRTLCPHGSPRPGVWRRCTTRPCRRHPFVEARRRKRRRRMEWVDPPLRTRVAAEREYFMAHHGGEGKKDIRPSLPHRTRLGRPGLLLHCRRRRSPPLSPPRPRRSRLLSPPPTPLFRRRAAVKEETATGIRRRWRRRVAHRTAPRRVIEDDVATVTLAFVMRRSHKTPTGGPLAPPAPHKDGMAKGPRKKKKDGHRILFLPLRSAVKASRTPTPRTDSLPPPPLPPLPHAKRHEGIAVSEVPLPIRSGRTHMMEESESDGIRDALSGRMP